MSPLIYVQRRGGKGARRPWRSKVERLGPLADTRGMNSSRKVAEGRLREQADATNGVSDEQAGGI